MSPTLSSTQTAPNVVAEMLTQHIVMAEAIVFLVGVVVVGRLLFLYRQVKDLKDILNSLPTLHETFKTRDFLGHETMDLPQKNSCKGECCGVKVGSNLSSHGMMEATTCLLGKDEIFTSGANANATHKDQ